MGFTMVSLLLGSAFLLPLPLDDGRTPIYRPTTITAPGSYILMRDITSPVYEGATILIRASDVLLDLNGHTVTTTGAEAYGILRDVGGGSLRITNGSVRGTGGNFPIWITAGHDVRIDHLSVSTAGRPDLTVTGVPFVVIEDNVLTLGDVGIGVGGAIEGRIARNIVHSASFQGISIASSSNLLITENVVWATVPGSTGIYASTSPRLTVENNNVTAGDLAGDALHLGSDSTVVNNTVTAQGGCGIYVDSRTNVHHNTITNSEDGICVVGDENAIDWNLTSHSSHSGIVFRSGATRSIYGFNRTPGSGTIGIDPGTENIDAGGNY